MMYRSFAIATLVAAPVIVMAVQNFLPAPPSGVQDQPATPAPAPLVAPNAAPAVPAPSPPSAAFAPPMPAAGEPLPGAGQPMLSPGHRGASTRTADKSSVGCGPFRFPVRPIFTHPVGLTSETARSQ